MDAQRFSHFLDSLMAWSEETPPRDSTHRAGGAAAGANQATRVKRLKGLLHSASPDWEAAETDFEPLEDEQPGTDGRDSDSDDPDDDSPQIEAVR